MIQILGYTRHNKRFVTHFHFVYKELNNSVHFPRHYKSHVHRRVFKQAVWERNATDHIFLAALFLLTTNHTFRNRVKIHVTTDAIHFENFPMNKCTAEEYTIFRRAQDLLTGSRHITVADLADITVVSGETFRVICNAMTIARYGMPKTRKQGEKGVSVT